MESWMHCSPGIDVLQYVWNIANQENLPKFQCSEFYWGWTTYSSHDWALFSSLPRGETDSTWPQIFITNHTVRLFRSQSPQQTNTFLSDIIFQGPRDSLGLKDKGGTSLWIRLNSLPYSIPLSFQDPRLDTDNNINISTGTLTPHFSLSTYPICYGLCYFQNLWSFGYVLSPADPLKPDLLPL